MTTAPSCFNTFLSLCIVLFLHLGCFFSFPSPRNHDTSYKQPPPPKRRRITPSTSNLPTPSISTQKPLKSPSSGSYFSRLLCFIKPSVGDDHHHPPTQPSNPLQPIPESPDADRIELQESAAAIYACPACGEVLGKPQLLDIHRAERHSLTELTAADSGYNIVRLIFQSGWKGKSPAVIHRVLKIHSTARTLARYEEYRDAVRARAARNGGGGGGGGGCDARCVADGNERLRFYCTTALCSMDPRRGGVCGSPYCCACAVVRHGFAGKHAELDGIATSGTSWGAHAALPEELELEFAFLSARRAMLVCRVVAGRVEQRRGPVAEKGGGFDSVATVCASGARGGSVGGEDELVVFSTRAVLPCFVIIYTV